jgi:hypothetical protein
MLVMEQKVERGREILQKALDMAVQQLTTDNTIRYVRFCMLCWLAAIVIGGLLYYCPTFSGELWPYIVAGMSGATGALLSVATRLQAFRLRPCDQSKMNDWMSGIRVGVGVIAGPILVLLAATILSDGVKRLVVGWEPGKLTPWQAAATLGLIAGFAERLIPNLLQRTGEQLESSPGTPVQAMRSEEMRSQTGENAPCSNSETKQAKEERPD